MDAAAALAEVTALLDGAVSEVSRVDDPAEREAFARRLAGPLETSRPHIRRVRAAAVRGLLDQDEMTQELAGTVLGLTRSGVRYLLGEL